MNKIKELATKVLSRTEMSQINGSAIVSNCSTCIVNEKLACLCCNNGNGTMTVVRATCKYIGNEA